MKEANYLAAILSGNGNDLSKMYAAFFPVVRKLVRDRGGNDDDAKDLVQDAVIVVYEKARQPGFVLTSQFGTFFCGICLNIWRSRRQKKVNHEVNIPEETKYMADGSGETDWLLAERSQLFTDALLKLGGDCQKLLQLFFQKTPMDKIALEMGYASEGYAARRKYLCKSELVRIIKASPTFPELQNA